MAASQSGYPMLADYGDPSLTSNPTVPGTSVEVLGGLKSGAPMIILLDVAERFNASVEPLVQSEGVWGFDPQHNTYTSTSNHKSGTAEDLNAARHPIGTDPSESFSASQIATIRAIVASYGGVVRWGGDYTGRKDPMHFEINDDLYGTGRVEAAAAAITQAPRDPGSSGEGTITPPPPPPAEEPLKLDADDQAYIKATVDASVTAAFTAYKTQNLTVAGDALNNPQSYPATRDQVALRTLRVASLAGAQKTPTVQVIANAVAAAVNKALPNTPAATAAQIADAVADDLGKRLAS